MDEQNHDEVTRFIHAKFQEYYNTFLGMGSQATSIYIEPIFHCTVANTSEQIISSEYLYSDLLEDEEDCTGSGSILIIGDSGLGKTSLGLNICKGFWEKEKKASDRLPVYIYLPSVVEHLQENILDKFCECEKIVQSLRKCKLLLILDGFDELKYSMSNVNIFEANHWCSPDIKTLILSRNNIYQGDKVRLLQCLPKSNDRPSFVEYVIQAFEKDQVDDYISKVDLLISNNSFHSLSDSPWGIVKREYDEYGWNKKKYINWFALLPDLRAIAQTPLLLTLILQVLPAIVRSSNSFCDEVRKFVETKVGIFDLFTTNWFKYQFNRLNNLRKFENNNHRQLTWPVFKTFCYAFAQNLAYSLIHREPGFPRNFGLLRENCFFPTQVNNWEMLEIVKYGHITDEDKVTWESCIDLFKKPENSDILEAIQNACLVKYVQSNSNDKNVRFQFFHRSIAEYFVSRDIFVELQGEFEYYLAEGERTHIQDSNIRGLNKFILKEVAVLEYLAERVLSDANFSDLLFKIIEQSKETFLMAIMSANAISILNIAGISFSGRDFRWIQIPGANLNHSLCGNTNFKGANLENVSFEDSWLAGAQFNGAKLRNTNFGINSGFQVEEQQKPLLIKFYQDWDNQKWFVYSLYCNYITPTVNVIKWDLAQIKQVLKFTLEDEARDDFQNNSGFCVIQKYLILWSEKLCIFCAKAGKFIANVLIPEMPRGSILPNVSTPYNIQVFDQKLFVGRGHCIREYKFLDSIEEDIPNITLTFTNEFVFDDEILGYEFVNNMGLVVSTLECNEFSFIRFETKQTVSYTVDFFVNILAVDDRPNRCEIALGGYEGILQILKISSNVKVKNFKLPCAGIEVLKYSSDFKFLAAGAIDTVNGNFIRIWETECWNSLNSIDVGVSTPVDFEFWSSKADEELILGVAFSESQDGIQFYTVLLTSSRMITQNKMFPLYAETLSCSVDGSFIAAVLQKHRFNSEQGPYLYLQRPMQYIVRVWSVEDGRKMYEFEFEYEKSSILHQMHFTVDNNIICIERMGMRSLDGFPADSPKGLEYFYIYDQTGKLIKNSTLIDYYMNCGLNDDFSSIGYNINHTGTLIARGLTNGSICLSELTPKDPFLQFKCHLQVPFLPKKVYFTTFFINFDPNDKLLISSASDDSAYDIQAIEICTIRIWDISTKQLLLELPQNYFRYPHFYFRNDPLQFLASSFTNIALFQLTSKTATEKVKPDKRFSIDFSPLVLPLFDYHEKLNFVVLHAGPKFVQLWKTGVESETKLLAAIHLWFDVTFLKFIPLSETKFDLDRCKILIIGLSNICCVAFRNFDSSLHLLWSHCSNLSLNVQGLCLKQCIQLHPFHHKELLARGAVGSVAHVNQNYIAKSNIIMPILGSTLLEPISVFRAVIQGKHNSKSLNISESEWILSAIGRRSNANSPISRLFEQHVFLALEGNKYGRRFIFEAHLRYDKDAKKVFFQIFPTGNISEFQNKYANCWVRQWPITAAQGMDLIADILNDYQETLNYNFFTKNCVKWSKRKVKNRGFNFTKRASDLIVVPPSALLERKMK